MSTGWISPGVGPVFAPPRQTVAPLLGPYGGVEGLHLAIGFHGFGVMSSPAVGEAVAQLVAGRGTTVNVDTHLARRFSGFVDFPIVQGFSRL